MPRADEYAGAETWCLFSDYHVAMPGDADKRTLAARCVRAWAAVDSGRVRVMWMGGECEAKLAGEGHRWHRAPSALDAITAALGGDDGTR